GLLKSGADWLVSFASSAEEANYTHPAKTRQHLSRSFLLPYGQATDWAAKTAGFFLQGCIDLGAFRWDPWRNDNHNACSTLAF
ncbi:hypothetical protein, partial [Vogesella mureinivorans]|uniref:hypothetical protein n=1 Tax=Vogesella mureinivorans TaxID=657276 RepID=UPI00197CEB69